MLWLSIHLPHAPLEALLPLPPDTLEAGVWVLERQGARTQVIAANRVAQTLGVHPGLGATQALALAPAGHALGRDTSREDALIETLALTLAAYTPAVVLQDDGLLLELQTSLRLFGGVRPLLRRIRSSSRACGVQPRLGLAPTPLGASLLARVPPQPQRALQMPRLRRLLAALPALACLAPLELQDRLEPAAWRRLHDLLQGIGCHTLAALRNLPRAALARRDGRLLLAALDRAFGVAPDPRTPYVPPPHWRSQLELMHRADDAGMLIFASQRLLQALAGWLTRHWLAVTGVSLHLHHESSARHDAPRHPPSVLRIELAQPSRDPAQLSVLLRERLQRLVLPAPVYQLSLRIEQAQAHAGTQTQWLPDPATQASAWAGLIDRLRARLGDEAVRSLTLDADHRPERAGTSACVVKAPGQGQRRTRPLAGDDALSALRSPGQGQRPCPLAGDDALSALRSPGQGQRPCPLAGEKQRAGAVSRPARPTWLVGEAWALVCVDGQPMHGGRLELLGGPERIEAGWFDDAPVTRDYHVAVGADQRLRWIYREHRGYDGEAAWFLHGWFA